MSAAGINGTSNRPTGWHFGAGGGQVTLEPAGGLTVVVRVAQGAPVERLAVNGLDEPVDGASWEVYGPGDEFVVEAERVLLRPRGGGGAAVAFAWSGPRLAQLAGYRGARGQNPSVW